MPMKTARNLLAASMFTIASCSPALKFQYSVVIGTNRAQFETRGLFKYRYDVVARYRYGKKGAVEMATSKYSDIEYRVGDTIK